MKFFEKFTNEIFHASHNSHLLSNYWKIIVIYIWKICEILRRIVFDNPNMSDLGALTRIEICHNRRFYDICIQLLIAELYLCWHKKDFVTFLSFNIVYADYATIRRLHNLLNFQIIIVYTFEGLNRVWMGLP